MFARVTTAQGRPENAEAVIKIMRDNIVPAAKKQKGFRGIYGLTDRKTGKVMSISLWETEADAIANEKSGFYQEQLAKVAPYLTGAPVREGYEVTSQG